MPSPFSALHRLIRSVVPIRVQGMPARARWMHTRPLSESWGFERGTPVDRYYIERFLDRNRADIRGDVLEIKSSAYTRAVSGAASRRVPCSTSMRPIRRPRSSRPRGSGALPRARFDCFVLTQTLQLIYDVRAAIQGAHTVLRPGGTLLVTVPCISRVVRGMGSTATSGGSHLRRAADCSATRSRRAGHVEPVGTWGRRSRFCAGRRWKKSRDTCST
jgi:hypothetical protein